MYVVGLSEVTSVQTKKVRCVGPQRTTKHSNRVLYKNVNKSLVQRSILCN
jgi:hypothetical protein